MQYRRGHDIDNGIEYLNPIRLLRIHNVTDVYYNYTNIH